MFLNILKIYNFTKNQKSIQCKRYKNNNCAKTLLIIINKKLNKRQLELNLI